MNARTKAASAACRLFQSVRRVKTMWRFYSACVEIFRVFLLTLSAGFVEKSGRTVDRSREFIKEILELPQGGPGAESR